MRQCFTAPERRRARRVVGCALLGRCPGGAAGGPCIVNNVVVWPTTLIDVTNIVYRNTGVPHAVLLVPLDKFGHERVRVTPEMRLRAADLAPAHSELPIRPTRDSLTGGAPRGIEPQREPVPQREEARREERARVLPGQPANLVFRGRERGQPGGLRARPLKQAARGLVPSKPCRSSDLAVVP